MASTVSKDANAVLSGASEEARKYAMENAPGDVLTSGEAKNLLSQYQAQSVLSSAGVSGQNPLSADNMQNVADGGTTAPDLNDPLGLKQSVYDKYGITGIKEELTAAESKLREFDAQTQEQQLFQGNRLVPLDLATGAQRQASEQAAITRTSLSNEVTSIASRLDVLQTEALNDYNILVNERADKQPYLAEAYRLGIKDVDYNTSLDTIIGKIGDVERQNEEKAKQEAEQEAKDKYKASLKAALIEAGLSTKTKNGGSLSADAMEKKLSEYSKELADREKQKFDLELENLKSQVSNRGGVSDADIAVANENYVVGLLDTARQARSQVEGSSWDGFLNPSDWKPVLEQWMSSGGSYTDFVKKFGGSSDDLTGTRKSGFINPKDI